MSVLNGRRWRPTRSGASSTAAERRAERVGAVTRGLITRLSIGATICIGLVLIIIGIVLWYENVYASPERVFWGTMGNGLSTPSVTKQVVSANQQTSSDEFTQVAFVPEPRVRDIKKFTTNSSKGPTKVTVETISTTSDSYRRYLSIERPTAQTGKKLNYSQVYSMWLKSAGTAQNSGSGLFGNAVFGAVLFGNLEPADRGEVLDLMHKAYKVDFNSVRRSEQAGRRVYTYDAVLNLRSYAKAARQYAADLGLPNAQKIDPNAYTAASSVPVTISVDVLAHEIKQIDYKATKVEEKYSGYGIKPEINLPKQTVSLQELQNALNAIK